MGSRIAVFHDSEVYPVEHSADGKLNAYYQDFCNCAGYRPNYSSCLDRIERRKSGRLEVTSEAACSEAIVRKACPAVGMRDREIKAGQAIFFVNRAKMNAYYRGHLEKSGMKFGKPEKPKFNYKQSQSYSTRTDGKEVLQKDMATLIGQESQLQKTATPSKTESGFAKAINDEIQRLNEQASSTQDEKVVELSKTLVRTNYNVETEGMTLLQIAKARNAQNQGKSI